MSKGECSGICELLSPYFDQQLDGDDEQRVARHLEVCAGCSEELASIQNLSQLASELDDVPAASRWSELASQLDEPHVGRASDVSSIKPGRRGVLIAVSAIAATLVLGLAWSAMHLLSGDHNHREFAVEFGQYLETFSSDPESAQRYLLEKYENQPLVANLGVAKVGYVPATASGVPQGYELVSTHVMKMPCCTCVQTLCRRADGSTLAIFEHDDEETGEWFGDRDEVMKECNGKECALVGIDDQIAASWKLGSRQVTLIGVRDVDEVGQWVDWLDAAMVNPN